MWILISVTLHNSKLSLNFRQFFTFTMCVHTLPRLSVSCIQSIQFKPRAQTSTNVPCWLKPLWAIHQHSRSQNTEVTSCFALGWLGTTTLEWLEAMIDWFRTFACSSHTFLIRERTVGAEARTASRTRVLTVGPTGRVFTEFLPG